MLAESKTFSLTKEVGMPWRNLFSSTGSSIIFGHCDLMSCEVVVPETRAKQLVKVSDVAEYEGMEVWLKLLLSSSIKLPLEIKVNSLHLHLTEPQLDIMNSIKRLPARAARTTVCANCTRSTFPSPFLSRSPYQTRSIQYTTRPLSPSILSYAHQSRTYASKSSADEIIEQIQDQYATARDEFEIATEETDKKSVYAADDRAAAREELDNLKALYDEALQGSDAEEVKNRVGGRIRELDNAVQALEKKGLED